MKRCIITHGSIFSGIGGFDLAAKWAGIETLWQIEKNKFCQKILAKHFPNAELYGDIKNVKPKILQPVDIISGGFPCQPFSTAGKRKGKTDDRYLWTEMYRIIRHLKPSWVIIENVTGLASMGEPVSQPKVEDQESFTFQDNSIHSILFSVEEQMVISEIIDDLEKAGYRLPETLDGTPVIPIIPACGVGAPHRRDRVWIIAYCDSKRTQVSSQRKYNSFQMFSSDSEESRSHSNTNTERLLLPFLEERMVEASKRSKGEKERVEFTGISSREWNPWDIEPAICRVAHGVKNRVDRIKALGAAVVPQIPYIFFSLIRELES